MKQFLDKIKSIVLELEKEKGSLLLFALFLREDPLEKWDIVTSASWLEPDDIDSYQLIASKIQNTLKDQEIIQVSRIVILDQFDDATAFLQKNFSVTNGGYEEIPTERLSDQFHFTIKRAYLFRCQK